MFVNIKYRITFVEQIERIMKTQEQIKDLPIYAISKASPFGIIKDAMYEVISIVQSDSCGSGYACTIRLLGGPAVYDITHFNFITKDSI